jgi:hypothetical protein
VDFHWIWFLVLLSYLVSLVFFKLRFLIVSIFVSFMFFLSLRLHCLCNEFIDLFLSSPCVDAFCNFNM